MLTSNVPLDQIWPVNLHVAGKKLKHKKLTIKTEEVAEPQTFSCVECGYECRPGFVTMTQQEDGKLIHYHPHCWVHGDDVADGLEWVISLTQTVISNLHDDFTPDFVRERAAELADVVEESWLGVLYEVKRLRRIAATPEAKALVARNRS